MKTRDDLAAEFKRKVPVAVKIAPDVEDSNIPSLAGLLTRHQVDGVIATNTTIDHSAVAGSKHAEETGGLSGKPLKDRANEVTARLYRELQGKLPIIGVGGIFTAEDAWQRLIAGADMVQIYTGFIYNGPGAVADIVNGLARRVANSGEHTLAAAVNKARQND